MKNFNINVTFEASDGAKDAEYFYIQLVTPSSNMANPTGKQMNFFYTGVFKLVKIQWKILA